MSTWAPSLDSRSICPTSLVPSLASLRDAADNDSDPIRRGTTRPRRRTVQAPSDAAVVRTSVCSGAGQGPHLQFRVLAGVGGLLGEQGAYGAEQESDRDGDDAGVLQREPVEVGVGEHRGRL